MPSFVDAKLPPDEILAAALSKLRLLVIRRDEAPVNEIAQNLAYIELLLDYPTEIALGVINRWPRQSKFWPAWYELEEQLELAEADADRPEQTTPVNPAKMIVKSGCIHNFADTASILYCSKLGRMATQAERSLVFKQAMRLCSGNGSKIGLPGEVHWLPQELPRLMPTFEGFNLARIEEIS